MFSLSLSLSLSLFLFLSHTLFPLISVLTICTVVYEHRSRLEKSLQKERLEHKKAKEGEKNNKHPILTLELYLHLNELWEILFHS